MNADPSIAPPDEPDPVLGRVIRRLREERGLSRKDLANRSGIDEAVVKQIEGANVDPPWATVELLADGLGVPVHGIASAVDAEGADAP